LHCSHPPVAEVGLSGEGVTFLSSFFIKQGFERDESLHFHELVRVVQWQHLGPDRFILAYALGHQRWGYRANPLEVMAYTLQRCFDAGAGEFDVEAVVRRELGPIVAALEARA
jgi:hypothetical protein